MSQKSTPLQVANKLSWPPWPPWPTWPTRQNQPFYSAGPAAFGSETRRAAPRNKLPRCRRRRQVPLGAWRNVLVACLLRVTLSCLADAQTPPAKIPPPERRCLPLPPCLTPPPTIPKSKPASNWPSPPPKRLAPSPSGGFASRASASNAKETAPPSPPPTAPRRRTSASRSQPASPTTPSWARNSASSPARPPTAGSSTPSTARRASSAASRCTRRSSP